MRILVTGITGSLGTAVSKRLLDLGHLVVGYSRDEAKQQAFFTHPNLTLYLGDVRDKSRLVEATREVDVAFHLAALKHVDKMEENPEEAILTNIVGTQNVLHAQRMNGIYRVIFTSTDKAAYPINVYGMTKGVGERLVMRNDSNVVCRYGNVLASRGSVVGKFVESLKNSASISITDPNMSRFWITIDEAADFVVSQLSASGGLKIPDMRAASLMCIAQAVAHIMEFSAFQVKHIGMRKGEKLQECLKTEYEGEETFSHRVNQYTEEDLIKVLTPIVKDLM